MSSDGGPHGLELALEPAFPWDGGCAYGVLNAHLASAGGDRLGPMSPMRAVQDAMFALQACGTPSREASGAWQKLRVLERRLPRDFFCYPVPPFALTGTSRAVLDQPMPVADLDMLDYARHIVTPAEVFAPDAALPLIEIDWRLVAGDLAVTAPAEAADGAR